MNPASHYTVLHRVDFSPRQEVQGLHFKWRLPTGDTADATALASGRFPAGTTIDFDTLFGNFYESDWYSYTALETVILCLEASGAFRATVYRRSQGGEACVFGELHSQPQQALYQLRLSRADAEIHPGPARMWLVVEAISDLTIHDVAWTTTDRPLNDAIAIGVCFTTFNRLPYLKRAVNELLSNEEACQAVSAIVIVNQGEPFSLDELLEPANRNRVELVHLLEQENFGGCGGFTRGILESIDNPALSHILLCDDDIVFESHSIVRLASFLGFCHDDVAVGGQMLDLLRPEFLYESGAFLHEKTLLPEPIGRDMSLRESATLDSLIDSTRVDYNGWWYLAFSKAIVERVALPIPCFIRGDDIEYGIRLKKHGIHTVVLPGLVVWHEPFYMKPRDWRYYYEVKNRLILESLHFSWHISKDLKPLWLTFFFDLLTCRYNTASLAVVALKDFLAGPAVAMTCSPSRQDKVVDMASTLGPARLVGDAVPLLECSARKQPRSLLAQRFLEIVALLMDLGGLSRGSERLCFIDFQNFNLANTLGKRQFVVRQPDGRSFLLFRRSWRRLVALLVKFTLAYLRVRFSQKKLVRRYRRAFAEYTSEAHWRTMLDMQEKPRKPSVQVGRKH